MALCFFPVLLVILYAVTVVLLMHKVLRHRSIWIGMASHATEVLLAVTLLGFPQGMSIRPMGLAVLMFLVAIAALFIGVPQAVRSIRVKSTRLSGAIGLLLNLTPLLTGVLSSEAVAYFWNLKFAA